MFNLEGYRSIHTYFHQDLIVKSSIKRLSVHPESLTSPFLHLNSHSHSTSGSHSLKQWSEFWVSFVEVKMVNFRDLKLHSNVN